MNRLRLEVSTASGTTTDVDVIVEHNAVRIGARGRPRARFDRELLRTWLARPQGMLVVDEVAWAVNRAGGGVRLAVRGFVPWWSVPEHALDDLRVRI